MLDKFIKEHIGKKNDNGYGAYPGECVSLVQRFNKVLGNPRQWGNGEAYRTNLVNNKLGVHVPLNKARAGDVIAGLNNSHIYGHVALVINSTQVLEQAGPTAGGDGIAKIGTIANFVKRYPNYKVTRLHAYKYVEPPKPKPTPNSKAIIKVGAKYVSKAAQYNNKPVNTKYIGTPLEYVLNKVADKPSWVYFPIMNSFVDKKDITFGDTPKRKTNREIANEVKLGRWGNGAERVKRLTEAGYDAKAIQDIVDADSGKKPANVIVVGSKVKIKQGSFYQGSDKGKPVSAYAYSKAWTVSKFSNGNALLSEINSWIAIKDLVKVI